MPFSPNQVDPRVRATAPEIGCVIALVTVPPSNESLGCGTPADGSLDGSTVGTGPV
jgi:hypothetical protein